VAAKAAVRSPACLPVDHGDRAAGVVQQVLADRDDAQAGDATLTAGSDHDQLCVVGNSGERVTGIRGNESGHHGHIGVLLAPSIQGSGHDEPLGRLQLADVRGKESDVAAPGRHRVRPGADGKHGCAAHGGLFEGDADRELRFRGFVDADRDCPSLVVGVMPSPDHHDHGPFPCGEPTATKVADRPAGRPVAARSPVSDPAGVNFALSPTEVPPGYPCEFERRLRLRDGRTVFIRPLTPADAPLLAEAFTTADPETLRSRFLGSPPRMTAALATRLTTLDYARRFALAAADEHTGRGVAIARYEAVGDGVADVAVVVDPAWRRVGVATALIELLAKAALDRGVREFSALYVAENRPVPALLGLAGGGRQLIHEGIAEAVVRLDRERVDAAVRTLESATGDSVAAT
jgi:GNAT superfamily N-acetyltransferase